MTVFVFRDGALVERSATKRRYVSDFPTPSISRIEPFESPVTGKEITSWRDRDRDMRDAGAVDPRDLPPPTKGRAAQKEAKNGRRSADTPFEWGRLPDPE